LSPVSWQPTATLKTLRLRAELVAAIREFFAARDVLEIETPALSSTGTTDPQLQSITARAETLGPAPAYLATSPEHAMKRLLAAGSGDIYQICRVFRDGELGRWHQPEFTLLEWYRVGWDDARLMTEVDSLLRGVLEPHRPLAPSARLSYREAFREHLAVDPLAADHGAPLQAALQRQGVALPPDTRGRALLDLALSTVILPRLDRDRVTFIYDFPADQAALARLKPGPPPVAARFEAFCGGLELANGFHELTDAREQRSRFEAERAQRRGHGRDAPPIDEALLAALTHGLPACAGVAVGVDRLIALAGGLPGVSSAVSFAHQRPRA